MTFVAGGVTRGAGGFIAGAAGGAAAAVAATAASTAISGITAAAAIAAIKQKGNEATYAISGIKIPKDLTDQYYMEMSISDYVRSGLIKIGTLNMKKRFLLPLPMQLVDGKQIEYQDNVGILPDMQVSAQVGTAARLSGYSVNQLMVVVLKNPTFKSFELTWKIAPRHAEDSKLIRDFIQYINKASSPGLTGGGAVFSFPNIFQMAFRSAAGNPLHDMLYRFKPAVVEKLRINFAPGQMPAFYHDSNGPESVEITMSFKELEYWISENYDNQATNVYGGTTGTYAVNDAQSALNAIKDFFSGFGNPNSAGAFGGNPTQNQGTSVTGGQTGGNPAPPSP